MTGTRERGRSKITTRETPQSTVSYTNTHIPMELVSDILSRLPVKSILRFKSVSKSFYRLINSPIFIKQQLDYSKSNPNPIFNAVLSVVDVPGSRMWKHIFRVNLIDALDEPIDLNFPFMADVKRLRVLGICDGLVCVMLCPDWKNSSVIVIFNPLTGDFRKIPPSQNFPEGEKWDDNCYYGFGVNGEKDYELFRMGCWYSFGDESDGYGPVPRGEAYSLTTNTWRQITAYAVNFNYLANRKACPRNMALPVFLGGVFYWEAYSWEAFKRFLVYFDVKREIFDELELPDDCNEGMSWMLSNLKEELVIRHREDIFEFDIWVFNEKSKHWVWKLSVEEESYIMGEYPENLFTFLGCAQNGKFVVTHCYNSDDESKLLLYDMGTEKIETLPYVDADEFEKVFLYTESLVSINASDDVTGADFSVNDGDDVAGADSKLHKKKRKKRNSH